MSDQIRVDRDTRGDDFTAYINPTRNYDRHSPEYVEYNRFCTGSFVTFADDAENEACFEMSDMPALIEAMQYTLAQHELLNNMEK